MTSIPCHPRVAQLRGYPAPSKLSLPQENVYVNPKICRSGTKRAASAVFGRLSAWFTSKSFHKPLNLPSTRPGHNRYRDPSRNIKRSNDNLHLFNPNKYPRPVPKTPVDKFTGSTSRRTNTLTPIPSLHPVSSYSVTNVNASSSIRSSHTLPTRTPSGSIDTISGYSVTDTCVESESECVPEPALRRGLYRSFIDSYSDPLCPDIDTSAFNVFRYVDVEAMGLDTAGERDVEEYDISEATLLEDDGRGDDGGAD